MKKWSQWQVCVDICRRIWAEHVWTRAVYTLVLNALMVFLEHTLGFLSIKNEMWEMKASHLDVCVCLRESGTCVTGILCLIEWQWQGDGGRWESYPPAACALLNSALSAGKPAVTLNAGSGTAYEVDLKNMVQINPVTKYRRRVRNQPVKPGM